MATSPRVGRLRVIAPRLRALLIASSLAVGLLQVTGPSVALASDGFTETGATTYTLNPAAGRVDVAIDVALKNTTHRTATTIYYFNAEYVWLEHQATNVRAVSVGSRATITVKRVKRQQYYDQYKIEFTPVIFYGATRKLHITYQIPSGAPRSDSPIRVGRAYADFCVVTTGLDGASTTVRFPDDFAMTFDAHGGNLTLSRSGSTLVYSSGPVAKVNDFWACLSGENEKGYDTATVQSPSGRTIELESWPEDATWIGDVKGQLDKIVVDLEALVGHGLPGTGPIVLREVGNGVLGQYAGFFDPITYVARVGEQLGQGGVIAHELSHAWFNNSAFAAIWLDEGSAEWARTSVTNETCTKPTKYPGTGSPNLADWQFVGPKATEEELAVVDYEYAAACSIMSEISHKIGPERMRAVLKALFEHELPYRTGHTVLTRPKVAAIWRDWLDAVDELGLVPAGETDLDYAQNLLAEYGITAGSGPQLVARSKARATFHALGSAIGDWSIPEAILQPMGDWKFDVATAAMTSATSIYAKAGEVAAALPDVDGRAGYVRQLFEAAKTQADLDTAMKAAEDEVASAKHVADAKAVLAAPQDLLTEVGLLGGADLQPTLAAAIAAVGANDLSTANADAASIQATLAGAPQVGQTRVAGVVGGTLLVLLLIAFFVLRRRRSRRRMALASAAAAPAAPASIAAPSETTGVVASPPDAASAEPGGDPPLGESG